MINWDTETNTMNLMTEAPLLSICLTIGVVLAVVLVVVLDKRKD